MSLLDYGPDVVTVYAAELVTDDNYGGDAWLAGSTPTEVRCRVQPLYTNEQRDQQTGEVFRIFARTFPKGPYSRVVWDGREWEIRGVPLRHNGSPRVAHVTVDIQALSPEVP